MRRDRGGRRAATCQLSRMGTATFYFAGSSIIASRMATVSQAEVDQAVRSILAVTGNRIGPDDAEKLYRHVGDRAACLNMIFSDMARSHLSKLALSASSEAEQPQQPVLASGRNRQGPFDVLYCTFPQQQAPDSQAAEPKHYTVRRQLQCRLGDPQKPYPEVVAYGIIRQRERKPE